MSAPKIIRGGRGHGRRFGSLAGLGVIAALGALAGGAVSLAPHQAALVEQAGSQAAQQGNGSRTAQREQVPAAPVTIADVSAGLFAGDLGGGFHRLFRRRDVIWTGAPRPVSPRKRRAGRA